MIRKSCKTNKKNQNKMFKANVNPMCSKSCFHNSTMPKIEVIRQKSLMLFNAPQIN